jgi:hypothetical protein
MWGKGTAVDANLALKSAQGQAESYFIKMGLSSWTSIARPHAQDRGEASRCSGLVRSRCQSVIGNGMTGSNLGE